MALRGSNHTLPLTDLIQSTATQRRTARIVAESSICDGQIFMVKGQVVHATYGDLVGEDAVHAMIATSELEYEVEVGVATQTRTITIGWQELLLDAARREDEGSLPAPVSGPQRLQDHEQVAARSHIGAPQLVAATEPEQRPTRTFTWVALALAAAATGLLGWVALRDRAGEAETTADATSTSVASPGEADAIDEHVYEVGQLEGASDRVPRLVHGSPAIAPRRAALMPSVVVRVHLDRAGKVVERSIATPRAELADYEAAALAAVTHYEFAPAEHEGRKVASWLNVPVGFEQPDPRGLRAVRIHGSDTIGGELGPALAAEFAQRDPHVFVGVEALGSSSAFAGLLDGEAELGASSRTIGEAELAQAEQRGVRLREWVIGYDGIAIIVHRDNPVRELDMVELAGVFSGSIDNWQQLGGSDRAIQPLGRMQGSGTQSFFFDTVIKAGGAETFAPSLRELDGSGELVAAVAADPSAIAYVGAAWVGEDVELVSIAPQAGAPAIAPSPNAITSGSYPIHRPLIFYARNELDRDSAAFLRFVLGERGQALVAAHGFVPVGVQSDEALPSLGVLVDSGVHVTRLHFASAETVLDDAQVANLNALATGLQPGDTIVVVGSATREGLVEGHQRLADLRAAAVVDALAAAGVAGSRMRRRSIVALGRDEVERRRVDVFVIEGR
jgi:phosphate binding protein